MAPPKPYIDSQLVQRVIDGDTLPDDGPTLLTALARVSDELAEVLRDGISDRDAPTMERARATSTVIDSAFLVESVARVRAARQQRTLFAVGASENMARSFFANIARVQTQEG